MYIHCLQRPASALAHVEFIQGRTVRMFSIVSTRSPLCPIPMDLADRAVFLASTSMSMMALLLLLASVFLH